MKCQAIRGVEDLIPPESEEFKFIIDKFSNTLEMANFRFVILPTFEDEGVFIRSVGETTDIVQKEMYTFEDRSHRKLALRPEGTASSVRSYIEHGVYATEPIAKWYYYGPMFRYERPQSGRKREFYQSGCEVFGVSLPGADAELINVANEFLKAIGIKTELEINSIGCPKCRDIYKRVLLSYLEKHKNLLCKDCLRRYNINPLRVLDCKVKQCQMVVANAPKITDYLCDECRKHFEGLKSYLKMLNVEYTVNPLLVRGLDYYTRTVFEFKSNGLTVLAGGRYDRLVKEMGGPDIPALGFAAGVDRLAMIMGRPKTNRSGVFIAYMDEQTYRFGLKMLFTLRQNGIKSDIDQRMGSMKSQMKSANRMGFKYAAIIGEEELSSESISLKNLETGNQRTLKVSNLITFLKGNHD